MEEARVRIRKGVPGDFNFIISTWLRSFKHSSYFAKRIRNSIFYLFHHEVVSRILGLHQTLTYIACDPLDVNVIYGYMVVGKHDENPLLHYVYVKSAFRRLGIANTLLKEAGLDPDKLVFSHWTFETDRLVEKFPNAVYIPYLI